MSQVAGYFLSLNVEETRQVEQYLSACDYPAGVDGIKELLLDLAADYETEDAERVRRKGARERVMSNGTEWIVQYLKDHPEVVQAAVSKVGGVAGTIAGMFTKKKAAPV